MLWRLLGRLWTLVGCVIWWVACALAEHLPYDEPSNCMFASIRRIQEEGGGYLMFEQSRYGPWAHCTVVLKDGRIVEFNPAKKRRRKLPPLLFDGKWYEVKKQ